MNRAQRHQTIIDKGLTKCYLCGEDIDFTKPHFERDYFNGETMDVRLECNKCYEDRIGLTNIKSWLIK